MQFVDAAREEMLPLTRLVIESLDEDSQIVETSFFTLVLIRITQMRSDEDLMNVFIELSTTAFQGFVFSQRQSELIDGLLATAERIALTLSVPTDRAH